MIGTILIAMEDSRRRRQIAEMLIKEGYAIIEAETGARARDLLRRRTNIALALVELGFGDRAEGGGVALIRDGGVRVPVVVLAAHEDDPQLEEAMAAGARDFLLLPLTPLRVKISLSNLFQHHALEREMRAIGRQGEEHLSFDELIAKSDAMQHLVDEARARIGQKEPLLILAEEGCVPSLYARTLHREDGALSGDFIALACGSPIDGVVETASDWQHRLASAVAQARHGTLFLQDVHLLGEKLQQHLLEMVEQFSSDHIADVRLVASAAANMDERVLRGEFDANLCALLGQTKLILPPLRTRREDIEALTSVLLSRILAETGRVHIRGMSEEVKSLLLDYSWPGNVTELENSLFRAVLLCGGTKLELQDFPSLTRELSIAGQSHSADEKVFFLDDNHIRPLAEIEAHVIATALKHYRGRISEVARRLRIGRSTLYRKMEEYKLIRDD